MRVRQFINHSKFEIVKIENGSNFNQTQNTTEKTEVQYK